MTSKKKKFKPGDSFPISGAKAHCLKAYEGRIKDSVCAFQAAATIKRRVETEFWNAIRNFYPELNDYEIALGENLDSLIIVREKINPE